jgi:hypothetical protein
MALAAGHTSQGAKGLTEQGVASDDTAGEATDGHDLEEGHYSKGAMSLGASRAI